MVLRAWIAGTIINLGLAVLGDCRLRKRIIEVCEETWKESQR
jgi:hypothetical protein